MSLKHYLTMGLVSMVLLLFSVTGGAADLLPPQQPIKVASDRLQQKLQDESFSKDFSQVVGFVDEVIDPHTDFDRISALVLGKNWRLASADERQRFKKEFRTLLLRTYSRAFVEFKGWSVRFLPLDMEKGADKVIVKTEVLQPGMQPVSVDYRMALSGGQWKAYDIMIEGVSLVTNYRATFASEIQAKGSLNAIILDLSKRNVEALAAPAKKS